MTRQFSDAFRNNAVGQYETTVGTSPIVRFYGTAQPANCAAASSGSAIAQGTLPSDYLSGPASGAVSKLGTWTVTGVAAAGAGTAAVHFRVFDSTGTTCHDQGSITVTGGGGDMTVDNVSIANAQAVTITSWTLTTGGA